MDRYRVLFCMRNSYNSSPWDLSLKRLTWSWQFPSFKSLMGAAILPAISVLRIWHLCSMDCRLPLFSLKRPDSALFLVSLLHFCSSIPSLWQNKFLLHPYSFFFFLLHPYFYCTLYNLYCSLDCISVSLCIHMLSPLQSWTPTERDTCLSSCSKSDIVAGLLWMINKCLWIYSEAYFVLIYRYG